MSEIQVFTLLATLVGFTATVFNLVAFLREKERSHVRAGILTLSVLLLPLLIYFAPRLLPGPVQRLVGSLPPAVAGPLQGWARGSMGEGKPAPVQTPPPAPPMQGSFVLELQRNLLGGVDGLLARFQFSNLSQSRLRITAYHLQLLDGDGKVLHAYYRVLPESIAVPGQCTEQKEIELDAEIRDAWMAWQELEGKAKGPVQVTWQAQDGQGQYFELTASNG